MCFVPGREAQKHEIQGFRSQKPKKGMVKISQFISKIRKLFMAKEAKELRRSVRQNPVVYRVGALYPGYEKRENESTMVTDTEKLSLL